jgi:alcohol dehydrogenase class IV
MDFNLKGLEKQFDEMAHALGVAGGYKAVPSFLLLLNEKSGLPIRLRDIGVLHAHIEPLSQLALADFCHPSNPKPVRIEDFKMIYERAW